MIVWELAARLRKISVTTSARLLGVQMSKNR